MLNLDPIHVHFCEATDSMQYRPPMTNLDSGCQIVYFVTGDNGCSVATSRWHTWPTVLVIQSVRNIRRTSVLTVGIIWPKRILLVTH